AVYALPVERARAALGERPAKTTPGLLADLGRAVEVAPHSATCRADLAAARALPGAPRAPFDLERARALARSSTLLPQLGEVEVDLTASLSRAEKAVATYKESLR